MRFRDYSQATNVIISDMYSFVKSFFCKFRKIFQTNLLRLLSIAIRFDILYKSVSESFLWYHIVNEVAILTLQNLLSSVRRCVQDYHMIEPGDRIAVGVSGGKDSLTTLITLQALSKFYPVPFSVEALTIDMGYDGADFSPITALCDSIGVRHTIVPTRLKELIFDVRHESNPCSLCANMRRGAVNRAALELGCRKVAYGHHRDDAVETLLLAELYEGRISCFQPVTYLDRMGITIIRPLLYLTEKDIHSFARRQELPVMPRLCPQDGNSKRTEVKRMIAGMEQQNPGVSARLFGAMQRLPLPGWEPEPDKPKPCPGKNH